MGNQMTSISKWFRFKKDSKLLILGLDGAGKTTILYQLKLHMQVNTVPTQGFIKEEIKYDNLTLTLMDVGGQDLLRPLWKSYFKNTHGIIFVIDSQDTERFLDAQTELYNLMMDPDLRDSILLIYANKQDMPGAIPCEKLLEKLEINCLIGRTWKIQPSVAKSGLGLQEGLAWLCDKINDKF